MGTLYYGDNLDILIRYIPVASVDLAYLAPPFHSPRLPPAGSALRIVVADGRCLL